MPDADQSVLDERGIFEGIALSALDGAACELHVSREELTLALADEGATDGSPKLTTSTPTRSTTPSGPGSSGRSTTRPRREDRRRRGGDPAPGGAIRPGGAGDQRPAGSLRRRFGSGADRGAGEPHRCPDPRAREPAATPALNERPPPATLRPRESQPPGDPALNDQDPRRREAAWVEFVSVRTGGDLLSQAVSHQVPSAQKGLTALFGMGRGVSPSLLPPKSLGTAGAFQPPRRPEHPAIRRGLKTARRPTR